LFTPLPYSTIISSTFTLLFDYKIKQNNNNNRLESIVEYGEG